MSKSNNFIQNKKLHDSFFERQTIYPQFTKVNASDHFFRPVWFWRWKAWPQRPLRALSRVTPFYPPRTYSDRASPRASTWRRPLHLRWCDKWRRMCRRGLPPNTPCPKLCEVEDGATKKTYIYFELIYKRVIIIANLGREHLSLKSISR